MVYSGLKDITQLDALIEALEGRQAEPLELPQVEEVEFLNLSGHVLEKSHHESVIQTIVLPMCKAFRSFAKEDFRAVVQYLLPLRRHWHRLGAAQVQQDVFELTLLVALAKQANVQLDPNLEEQRSASLKRTQEEEFALRLVRSLASERIHAKKLCPQSWMFYAKVLHELDDPAYADSAYRRALDLGLGQGGNL